MANSKSNIYPIQLQGAELNLNKLDAEIKQYSGFNKNNSPFVGGCLSNVFTKEEQISGGNADNTYIDTNGDVYEVKTDGLYKNNDILINYPEGTKFYQKRKLNINRNVKKALSEKIYITVENDIWFTRNDYEYHENAYQSYGFVAHWGDGFSKVICCVESLVTPSLDIAYKDGKIAFSCQRVVRTKTSPYYNSIINNLIFIPNENENISYEYSPFYDSQLRIFNVHTGNMEKENISQSICFKEDGLFWAFNARGNSKICFLDYATHELDIQGSFTTNSPNNVITTDFNCWYMTQEGKLYFFRFGGLDFTFPSSTQSSYYAILWLSYDSTNKFTAKSYGGPNISMDSAGYLNNKEFYGESWGFPLMGIMKPYGCHYVSRLPLVDPVTQGLLFSISDHCFNLALTVNEEKTQEIRCATGGQILINGFKILINDNRISNISIARMHKMVWNGTDPREWVPDGNSWNGNLVEDWNIIKDLIVLEHSIVYQTYDNEFYVVEETNKPSLKFNYNQLVVNCNHDENAYNIRLGEVIHFAPDWNCSYLKPVNPNSWVQYPKAYGNFPTENLRFIASAINEYNEKYNPSIILNMTKVVIPTGSTSVRYDIVIEFAGQNWVGQSPALIQSNVFKGNTRNCCINFYCDNATPNQTVYYSSGCVEGFFNKDLEGLPFPNNTDGNIPYVPNIFSKFIYNFGTDVFVKNNSNVYQLMKRGQDNIMSFFLGTLVEDLDLVFIIQGQYYGIINNKLFALQFQNSVIADSIFIVNIQSLQFVGNTPYEALFFSKTNRCLYSFTGANVLNQKQLVDKISEVRNYLYNPATQTVFLITDIGVLFYGLFGMFLLEYTNITNIFLLDNGIVMSDNSGNYRYIKYYLDEGDEGYTKENIRLETCFYGMNNEVVTINDCLYFRLFSEEYEEGDLKVSATTISLSGRKTEETTFKIKASDWDAITHTIYLRYQPKTQRGLGVSFSIDSPFKIASMSVGSQPDAVLVDRVSKGAITASSVTTNNNEW